MPVRVQFDYAAICDLLEIPHRYTTGMGIEIESGPNEGSFATMTVTLTRPLTKEEWIAIANLALEGT